MPVKEAPAAVRKLAINTMTYSMIYSPGGFRVLTKERSRKWKFPA
jgi:hypothetical protein